MSIVITHTDFKYNWRFARLEAYYVNEQMSARRIYWYAPKKLNIDQYILQTTPQQTNIHNMPNGRPGYPGGGYPDVTTRVNVNDEDGARIQSCVFGYLKGVFSNWVPFHVFNFRIPVDYEVTYHMQYNTTYTCSYFSDLIECEFLGEGTVDPNKDYGRPTS